MSEPRREDLLGAWVHSHEEDSGSEQVYRRGDYDFPPSRGRDGFELRANGDAVLSGPGPTDVPAEADGRWELDGTEIRISGPPGSTRLQVASVSPERLVVSDTGD